VDEPEKLAERFEEQRERLTAVAYRMLGSRGEAEDAVQETWLRLARVDPAEVGNLPAWLRTVLTRVILGGAGGGGRHGAALAARSRQADLALINGTVGLIVAPAGRLRFALTFSVQDDRITEYTVIADPERLDGLALAVLE
jgi:hypothetical protein